MESILFFSFIIVIDDIIKNIHYIETSDRIRCSNILHVHLCLKHASPLKVTTDSRCLHEVSQYD